MDTSLSHASDEKSSETPDPYRLHPGDDEYEEVDPLYEGDNKNYLQRLFAGLCVHCGVSIGVPANQRHTLPRIDGETRGEWSSQSWHFIGPCGHSVMEIGKGSDLLKE